jgi:hypothetical protein
MDRSYRISRAAVREHLSCDAKLNCSGSHSFFHSAVLLLDRIAMSERAPVIPILRIVQPAASANDETAPPSAGANTSEAPDWLDRVRSRVHRRTAIALSHPILERIAAVAYVRSIWIHCLFGAIVLFFSETINPTMLHTDLKVANPLAGILVVITLTQIVVLLLAHVALMRELSSSSRTLRPLAIWNMYVSCLMTFATIYFTLFAYSRWTFDLQGYVPDVELNPAADAPTDSAQGLTTDPATAETVTAYNDPSSVYIFFLYFSSAIITSTGFGDIIPSIWYSQMLTNLQMLIGMAYHVGVFGLALDHL